MAFKMNYGGASLGVQNAQLAAMRINMGMGMGMGMGVQDGFFYGGNSIGLETQLQNIQDPDKKVSQAAISVLGNQVKEMNNTCMICTILWGSIILIPIFFMCCQWWKKIVNAAYEVPVSTYQALAGLLSKPDLKSVTLTVMDSAFDGMKAQMLYDMVSRSSVRGFTFMNIAPENNYTKDEYTRFKEHMRPFKNLGIQTDLRWGTEIVM